MKAIWKYMVQVGDESPIKMPDGARVIHVAGQVAGIVAFWAEVDPDGHYVERRFRVAGTGEAVPTDGTHVGSALDGPFVWHLYELGGA